MTRLQIIPAVFIHLVLLILLLFAVPAKAETTPILPGYAVASAHPLATNAGLEILAQGGNAFDAAVGVSAALAVVEPYHSGLGGGGFWLLHLAKTNKNIFIDGREAAPKAATKTMFLDSQGKPIPGLSLNGGLAAAIPGEPAAIVLLAKQYGRLPLSKSLAPAIRLAEQGFVVDHQFNYFSTMGDRQQQLQKYPASATIFLHNGNAYQVGERLIQQDLAKTLRILAKEGHEGFYKGKLAQQMVDSVNKAGGIWAMEDLASYQLKLREPLVGSFHQMKIITAPLPSAGGVALLTMLNVLADYPLQSISRAQKIHYLVEAMRLAYWQRTKLADPDHINVSVSTLLSAANTQYLRSLIKPDKATPNSVLTGVNAAKENTTTTHFSILDSEGNRVAATLTINYIFGCSVVADGTGVLLNDQMDDFSVKANEKNVFGVAGSEANTIAPRKRPLSSMTPTFLEMPGRLAILGTPGGSRIPTMVLLAALAFHDEAGAISMVSAMRFHHQHLPDSLVFEPDTFPATLQQELVKMGYHLVGLEQYYGDMQAITWDRQLNLITAASDPRHIGMAATIASKNIGGYGFTH